MRAAALERPVLADPDRDRHGLTAPRGRMTVIERGVTRLVIQALRRIDSGTLEIVMPDGAREAVGRGPARGRLEVRHPRFFTRLVRDGEIGLGEAWTAGEFETPDLPGLLELLARGRDPIERSLGALAGPRRFYERLRHGVRANTLGGSRRNIPAHYDLGNAFFATFLDPSLTYSSARFEDGDTLERAQERKLDRAMELAGLAPGQRVLEIGSGWGSFAVRAAQRMGCRVTSLTLSPGQLEAARARAAAAGVADRIHFVLCDYRQVTGSFDAVVSIEMIEAVGHEFLGAFFGAIDRVLAPSGRVVIQGITIADDRYEEYRRRPDWLQKHIFPGGMLPCMGALRAAMARHGGFAIERLERFGLDYARTLAEWRARFEAREAEVVALGYPETFRRAWRYYLAYCEAGFRVGTIDVSQMSIMRGRG